MCEYQHQKKLVHMYFLTCSLQAQDSECHGDVGSAHRYSRVALYLNLTALVSIVLAIVISSIFCIIYVTVTLQPLDSK